MAPLAPNQPANQSDSSGAVSIILQASDQASAVITKVKIQFVDLSSEAIVAAKQVQSVGYSLARLGAAATLQPLIAIAGALKGIRTAAQSDIGSSFLEALAKQSDEIVGKTAKLSSVLKTVALPAGALLTPVDNFNDQIVARSQVAAKNVTQVFKKQLGNLIEDSLGGKASNTFDVLASALDQQLTSVIVNKAIGKNIPDGLKDLYRKSFGGDLVDALKPVLSNSLGSSIAPQASRLLASAAGGVSGLLEATISRALESGFTLAATKGRKILRDVSISTGQAFANAITGNTSNLVKFEKVDKLFGNVLSEGIGKLADAAELKAASSKVGQKLGQQMAGGLAKEIAAHTLIGASLGSLLGAQTGEIAKNFLNLTAGYTDVINQLSGEAFSGIGESLFELADGANASNRAVGALARTITEFASKKLISLTATQFVNLVPPELYQAIDIFKTVLPEEFDALSGKISDTVAESSQSLAKFATTTPLEKIQSQIAEIQSSLDGAEQAAQDLKQLQDEISSLETQKPGQGEASDVVRDTTIDYLKKQEQGLRSQAEAAGEAKKQLAQLTAEESRLKSIPTQINALRSAIENTYADSTKSIFERVDLARSFEGKLEELESQTKAPIEEFAKRTQGILGTAFDFVVDGDSAQAQAESVKKLLQVDEVLGGLVSAVGVQAGKDAIAGFSVGLAGGLLNAVAPIIDQADEALRGVVVTAQKRGQDIEQTLSTIGQSARYLGGLSEPIELFKNISNAAAQLSGHIFEVSQQVFFMTSAFTALQGFAQKPFDLLIKQNVELQQSILSTQASIVSTGQVLESGFALTDPTQSITALQAPIEAAIAKLRQGSLELAGVTSQELVPVFQQVAQQSSLIGASIDDAVELSLKFAATLGTLGVPLYQARQEIGSILTGTIDQNSIVAKTLGITNQQITTFISQGRAVEELNKRLEVFRKGNQLAAQTFTGITSNIKELFEVITQKAGASLLEPIIKELDNLYKSLDANKDAILGTVNEQVGIIAKAVGSVYAGFKQLLTISQGAITQIPIYLVKSLGSALTTLGEAIVFVTGVLTPTIQLFAKLAAEAGPLGGIFAKIFIFTQVFRGSLGLLTKAFATLANILPIVGEGLFFLNIRSLPILNTISNLTPLVDQGAASFLAFGKRLNSLPGVANVVAAKLGPLGGLITPLIPAFSSASIGILGFASQFPLLSKNITAFAKLNPSQLVEGFLKFGQSVPIIQSFTPAIQRLADGLTVQTKGASLAAIANQKFAETMKAVRAEMIATIKSTIVGTGGFLLLVYLLNELVLKSDLAQAVLGKLKEVMAALGKIVNGALNNPLVQAVGVVAGLAAVVQLKLIPALFGATAQMIALTNVRLATWATSALESVKELFTTLRGGVGASAIEVGLNENIAGVEKSRDKASKATFADRTKSIRAGLAATVAEIAEAGSRANESITRALVPQAGALKEGTFKGPLGTFGDKFAQQAQIIAGTEGKVSGAITKMASGFGALKTAVAGITSEIGGLIAANAPILALAAVIAAVTFAYNDYSKSVEAATHLVKEQTKALKESADAIERIELELAKRRAQKQDVGAGRKTPEQREAELTEKQLKETLEKIKKERNILEQARDLLIGGTTNTFIPILNSNSDKEILKRLQGTTRETLKDARGFGLTTGSGERLIKEFEGVYAAIDQNSEALDKLYGKTNNVKSLESERADLIRQRSKAGADGDQQEADRLDTLIKQKESEISQYATQAKTIIATSKQQLASNAINQEQREGLQNNVTQAEKFLTALEKIRDVTTTLKPAQFLGPGFNAQLVELEGILKFFSDGGGDEAVISTKATRALELVSQAQKLGTISQAAAADAIRNTALAGTANPEVQAKGIQALTETYRIESDRLKAINDATQGEIENRIKRGRVDTIKGYEELLKGRQSQLEKEKNLAIDAINEELNIQKTLTSRKLNDLDDEILKAQVAGDSKKATSLESDRKKVNGRLLKLEVKLQQDLENTRKTYKSKQDDAAIEDRVRVIDAAQKKALQIATQTENQRSQQTARLQKAGLIFQGEIEARKADNALRSVNDQLAAEQTKFTEIKKYFGRESDAYREQQAKVSALVLQRLNAEIEAQNAQVAKLKESLARQTQAFKNNLDKEDTERKRSIQLIEEQTKALELQSTILNARKNFGGAFDNLAGAQLEGLAALERSEYRRQEIARTTEALKYQSLLKQQEIELRLFDIEQQKNDLALKREQIQARIDINAAQVAARQAKDAVTAAEKDRTTTPEQLQALRQSLVDATDALKGRRELATVIDEQRKAQPEIAALSRGAKLAEIQAAKTSQEIAIFNKATPSQKAQLRPVLQQRLQGEFAQTLNNVSGRTLPPARADEKAAQQLAEQKKGNDKLGAIADSVSGEVAVSDRTGTEAFRQTGARIQDSVLQALTGGKAPARQEDPLLLFDQTLEQLRGKISGADFEKAYADANRRFTKEFGPQSEVFNSERQRQIDGGGSSPSTAFGPGGYGQQLDFSPSVVKAFAPILQQAGKAFPGQYATPEQIKGGKPSEREPVYIPGGGNQLVLDGKSQGRSDITKRVEDAFGPVLQMSKAAYQKLTGGDGAKKSGANVSVVVSPGAFKIDAGGTVEGVEKGVGAALDKVFTRAQAILGGT